MSLLDISAIREKVNNNSESGLRTAIQFMYPEFKEFLSYNSTSIENDKCRFTFSKTTDSQYLFQNGALNFVNNGTFFMTSMAEIYYNKALRLFSSVQEDIYQYCKRTRIETFDLEYLSKPKYEIPARVQIKDSWNEREFLLSVYHIKLQYLIEDLDRKESLQVQSDVLEILSKFEDFDVPLTRKINCSRKRISPKDPNSLFNLKGQIYRLTFFGVPDEIFKEDFLLGG